MEYILDFFELFWYDDNSNQTTYKVNNDYIAIRQIDNEDPMEDPNQDPDFDDSYSVPFLFDISRVYGTMYQRVY